MVVGGEVGRASTLRARPFKPPTPRPQSTPTPHTQASHSSDRALGPSTQSLSVQGPPAFSPSTVYTVPLFPRAAVEKNNSQHKPFSLSPQGQKPEIQAGQDCPTSRGLGLGSPSCLLQLPRLQASPGQAPLHSHVWLCLHLASPCVYVCLNLLLHPFKDTWHHPKPRTFSSQASQPNTTSKDTFHIKPHSRVSARETWVYLWEPPLSPVHSRTLIT